MNIFKLNYILSLVSLILIFSSCRRSAEPIKTIKKLSWEDNTQQEVTQKKRVLIFSSTGGGGHTAASQAIRKYLGTEKYDVESVNVFSDIIQPMDLIHYYTGAYTGEKMYDFLLQNQFILLAQMYVSVGKSTLRFSTIGIEKLLEEFLIKNRPDAIVSIIPIVNGAIFRVAKKLNIPFVIIPVDLNVSNYCNSLDASDADKFLFCLNFDKEEIRKKIKCTKVADEKIRCVGFPVRPDFLTQTRSLDEIKREFAIPENKKIVMVLMGSAGSRATLRYAKALSQMQSTTPLHVILCLGRNESLRQAAQAITFPPHYSVTIMGFTDKIADLMRISDVLITKSGPTSIFEALSVGTPMIIEHTQKILWWEKMNIDFVLKHGLGDELRRMRALPQLLQKYIQDDVYTEQLRNNMKQFSLYNVRKKVCAVIDETLAMNNTNDFIK